MEDKQLRNSAMNYAIIFTQNQDKPATKKELVRTAKKFYKFLAKY